MARDMAAFDVQSYLDANPDVAGAGIDPTYHYIMFGENEGRQGGFPTESDPEEVAAQAELDKYLYADPGNPFLLSTGQESAKDIVALKTSNPDLFYQKMADSAAETMFTNWSNNRSGYNSYYEPVLESIKAENPAAYYTAKLNLLGKQQGWQHGQNTSERSAGQQAEINALAPEALKVGLTSDQINSLVGTGFSEASTANQQRIANAASQGNFWTDNLIGTGKVGLLALGAYGVDTALAQAASAGVAT